ncbi:tetratricopeptide repeat (TPR)-like superfamily protein [Artemisia annua]|uniref:Tetratricopeptide repeat (TPR)-like superfamily protein n=1 Tax=Artemisia annua TaxID=35608 RepID=A0A2U1MB09_ARTAN|nr:tetratricopeptide repeat (TPR)-like superfamily protein [Artemisia annua]
MLLNSLNHVSFYIYILLIEDNTLWCKVIRSIHGPQGGLHDASLIRSKSGPWYRIAKLKEDLLNDYGINLPLIFKKKIGNGESTRFWLDNWLGGPTLKETFPHIFRLDNQPNCLVCDRVPDTTNGPSDANTLSPNTPVHSSNIMIEDLASKETSLFLKDKESALELKIKGNGCALRVAPRDVDDMGKNLVAMLYVNRAAVLQKMGLLVESLQDCNQALAISRSYSKAWYRRGKANTSMGNYNDAVCDLKISLCTEQSLSGKRQIEGELKLIVAQHNGKDFPPYVANYKDSVTNGPNMEAFKHKSNTKVKKERKLSSAHQDQKVRKEHRKRHNCKMKSKIRNLRVEKTTSERVLKEKENEKEERKQSGLLGIEKDGSSIWYIGYRRGKANTSMGNYNDAVCDLKISLCTEQSLSGKRQIEGELKLIVAQHNGKDFPPYVANYKDSVTNDQPQQIQLQCVSTETKGRGMVSLTDVPQATLLHSEEPYAAIVSKHCRETHCHFCFSELLADIVPCPSCSMALYCSQVCQIHARGQDLQHDTKNHEIGIELSSDLEKYVANVTEATVNDVNIKQNAEHRHECGVNWPAALPAEIVLAGWVIVKSIEQHGKFGQSSTIVDLDLCHNYIQLDSEAKLELHISSIVLLKCLHNCYGLNVPLNGDTISQSNL